jgi:hypothetical protein
LFKMFPPEAETLLPCPACRGAQRVLTEHEDGRYHSSPCRWCKGTGAVGVSVLRKFFRWRRILQANAVGGRCKR